MQISFYNKVVIITGGASGIGQACCELFLAGGATVIVLDLDYQVENLADQHRPNLFFYPCDLADSEQIKGTFQKISGQFSAIDVLINNAGIQTYGNLEALSEQDWERTLNVNTRAGFLCAKHALSLLREAPDPVIINVASVKTQVCQENELAYVTSKAALLGLTRSIASDYAPHLRCVTVSPGAVDTPLLREEIKNHQDAAGILKATEDIHLLKRLASAEEIANVIYFLASDKASFMTGHEYRVDGGIGIKIQGT